jgi:hypothetical protein
MYREFNNDRMVLGFGGWIMKTIGQASIKMGLAVSAPTKNMNMKSQDTTLTVLDLDSYEKGPWVITVPIIFGYYL